MMTQRNSSDFIARINFISREMFLANFMRLFRIEILKNLCSRRNDFIMNSLVSDCFDETSVAGGNEL